MVAGETEKKIRESSNPHRGRIASRNRRFSRGFPQPGPPTSAGAVIVSSPCAMCRSTITIVASRHLFFRVPFPGQRICRARIAPLASFAIPDAVDLSAKEGWSSEDTKCRGVAADSTSRALCRPRRGPSPLVGDPGSSLASIDRCSARLYRCLGVSTTGVAIRRLPPVFARGRRRGLDGRPEGDNDVTGDDGGVRRHVHRRRASDVAVDDRHHHDDVDNHDDDAAGATTADHSAGRTDGEGVVVPGGTDRLLRQSLPDLRDRRHHHRRSHRSLDQMHRRRPPGPKPGPGDRSLLRRFRRSGRSVDRARRGLPDLVRARWRRPGGTMGA